MPGKDYSKKRDKSLITGCILSLTGIVWAIIVVISQISHAVHYSLDDVFSLSTTFLLVLTFSVLFTPAVVFSAVSLKRRKRANQKTLLARISLITGIVGLVLALLQLAVYLYRLFSSSSNLLS